MGSLRLQPTYDQMQALGADVDFEYDRTDICRDCVWAEVECKCRFICWPATGRQAESKRRATDQKAVRAHQQAVENYNSLKNTEHIDVDAETYLVSAQWLKCESQTLTIGLYTSLTWALSAWLRDDWTEKKENYDHGWWNQCRSEIQCFHHAVKPKVHRKNCLVINEAVSPGSRSCVGHIAWADQDGAYARHMRC